MSSSERNSINEINNYDDSSTSLFGQKIPRHGKRSYAKTFLFHGRVNILRIQRVYLNVCWITNAMILSCTRLKHELY